MSEEILGDVSEMTIRRAIKLIEKEYKNVSCNILE